jgi:hypothetical protein
VGPAWRIGAEEQVAAPIVHEPSGASWNVTFAGTSDRCTGNRGGEK